MKIYIYVIYVAKKILPIPICSYVYVFFFLNVLSYYLTNTTIFFLFKSLHSFLERPMQVVFKTEKWVSSFLVYKKLVIFEWLVSMQKKCILSSFYSIQFFICKWWSIKLCKMANYPFSGNKNHTDTVLSFSELCLLPLWIADKLTNMLIMLL